jgi:hypothetical protein
MHIACYILLYLSLNNYNGSGRSIRKRRYDEFCDDSGSWLFEIREYHGDLNSIAPIDIPPDPTPQEAYRAVVFLEGFIQEQKSTKSWSDDAVEEFESFDSTVEVEAVATALREIAGHGERPLDQG